jgi:hypothetical protein
MLITPAQRREIARIALAILERDYDRGLIPTAIYLNQRKQLVRQAHGAPAKPTRKEPTP